MAMKFMIGEVVKFIFNNKFRTGTVKNGIQKYQTYDIECNSTIYTVAEKDIVCETKSSFQGTKVVEGHTFVDAENKEEKHDY
ncbi:hypothetical protein HCC36_10935 [Listeria booriae]|uniref:DUF2187 domain-containing protein n=1 Tax=Listeria booriae TaxID=1552123 RepID=A0A842G9X3_9LIST|nr:hypothetical protein [Listeria booriae]MBC2293743.1 hypothetical protein [Listeria booriae]